MTETPLPAAGLTFIHDSLTGKNSAEPRQIIQLNVVESLSKDILNSLRNNDSVRLRLGRKPTIHYAKRSVTLNHYTDPFASDIYTGSTEGSRPMYFSGRLSHTLEVQKAREDTAKSDEALAALENTLKSMQEHRASNEASLVKPKGVAKRDLKPVVVAGRDRFLGSTPSSPFLSGRSPGSGPTSAPLLSAAPSKDKMRMDAMRIPVVHLLAVGPMANDRMAELLNVSQEECEKVLDKVSREVNGKRELKEKLYRELDVWKFPYKTQEDRQHAIDHAVQAYDRTRLERNDKLWQLLLPKDERDKGKVLSKLNFDKPIVPPKPTGPPEKDSKADTSDGEEKPEKPKKPKVVKESIPRKKANDDNEAKMTKSTAKLLAKLAKKESKYKSSERIEDSDEEAEAGARNTVKATMPVTKIRERADEKPQTRALPPKASLHKARLSESSSSSAEGGNSTRPSDRETTIKARPRPEPSKSKMSPRARTDSSPQKPSPLARSPPTNSTDLEESSKGSTQSSAPSSPPSSNDIPLAQQRRNYSPVVGAKTKESIGKRKSERSDDEPPAKKQQMYGDKLNSFPKSLTSQLQHPTPERRSSGSSASSPDKSKLTKQDVIAKAKSFTTHYGKYRDLHERLSRLSSKEREDREIDKLWRMHQALEDLKADIWEDWALVGGGD